MGRRSPGSGCLYVRRLAAGEVWYGKWTQDGQQVKRKIGAKRQQGTRDGLTRVQAETRLRELMASGINPVALARGDALTMAELGRSYIDNHLRRKKRKTSTVAAVESILRIWLVPFFGERDLRKLRAEDINDLIRMMETGGRPGVRQKGDRRYGRPVADKTIRNYIGTLSSLLSFGERKGLLPANVARQVELPGVPRYADDIRFLEPDEIQAVANAALEGPYQALDRALYITAAMTGLRQGELCALRWRDVDWPVARIRVRQNYVLGEFGTTKSRRSERSVPMADAVAGELDRLFKASSLQGDDDLVFADPLTGQPLSKAAILRRFRGALRVAQLDESHRFHDLRHTFGTRMAAAGVPMRTLQEWMGHRDIETTQRYADYAPSAHEAAFVEAAFGSQLTAAATPAAIARSAGKTG